MEMTVGSLVVLILALWAHAAVLSIRRNGKLIALLDSGAIPLLDAATKMPVWSEPLQDYVVDEAATIGEERCREPSAVEAAESMRAQVRVALALEDAEDDEIEEFADEDGSEDPIERLICRNC